MKSTEHLWCRGRWAALTMALVTVVTHVGAAPTLLDFEGLADTEAVTTQYVGVTFANATAINAATSLNEFEFPPKSGTHVVFDTYAPIEITFADLMASVAGYFTYLMPLELTAYDGQGSILGSVGTRYNSNLGVIPNDPLSGGDAGSTPNELLQVTSAAGIRRVTIAGDLSGGSFTLDDLTFERLQSNTVPEPSTVLLVALGLVGLGRRRARVGG